jgi:4-amino-4-deoxy-L-arabinose transferase-like glycosyltransferase
VNALTQGVRPYLLLTLLCAVLFAPGLAGVPVMDRDEARYMQATRQMAESGDYVVVRFQDDLRAKKPVGIHWLQAAAVAAFSHPAKTEAWPYRLPSALGVLLAVLMTFRVASGLFDRRIALLAGGLLASSLMAVVEAHLAKTDGVLLGLTTVVMGCFALIYAQGKGGKPAPSWAPLALWLALGCAMLVKGPVPAMILVLSGLALAAADRDIGFLRGLRPVMGVVLATAVVLPWLVAVNDQTQGAFVAKAVGEDLLPKLLGAQESHGAPPGTYLLLAGLTFWPASLFLWPALWRAWRQRTTPGLRFCLAWAVPAWIAFELIPTKLPHYTLPLYPALAMMVAAALFAVRDGTYDLLSGRGSLAWYAVWSLLGLALAAVPVAAPMLHGDGPVAWSWIAALGGVAAVAGAWVQIARRRFLNAAAAAMAGAAVLWMAVFGGVMADGLDDLWVSEAVAQARDAHAPGGLLAVAGYHEPSLVFLAGTATRLTGGAGAADTLATVPGALAAVEERQMEAFRGALPAGLAVAEVATIDGFNYSRGDAVTLHLFTRAGTTP